MKTLTAFLFICVSGGVQADTNIQIIGGSDETYVQVLDAVVPIFLEGANVGNHFCTGTYLGNGKLLTAGHCTLYVKRSGFVLFDKPKHVRCFIQGYEALSQPHDGSEILAMDDIAVITVGDYCHGIENGIEVLKPRDEWLSEIVPLKILKNNGKPEIVSGLGGNAYGPVPGPADYLQSLPTSAVSEITTLEQLKQIAQHCPGCVADGLDKVTETIFAGIQSGRKVCYATNNGVGTPYFGDSGGPGYRFNRGTPEVTSTFSFMLQDKDGKVLVFCMTHLWPFKDWLSSVL